MLFFPFSRAIRVDDHRLTIIKRRSSQVRHRGIYSQSMIIVNYNGCQGKLVVGIMWSRWARVTWSQIGSRFSGVGVSLAHLGSRVDHWSLCPSWAASRIMYNHVCGGLLLAFFRFVCVFYLFFIFAFELCIYWLVQYASRLPVLPDTGSRWKTLDVGIWVFSLIGHSPYVHVNFGLYLPLRR